MRHFHLLRFTAHESGVDPCSVVPGAIRTLDRNAYCISVSAHVYLCCRKDYYGYEGYGFHGLITEHAANHHRRHFCRDHAYCVFGGLEGVSRLGEMFLPIVLIMFCLEVIFLVGSNVLNVHNLLPVLEKGWEPVWKVVYPSGITQSFAETLVFAMFWAETKQPEKVVKITVLATLLSGLMVTCFDLLAIFVFGDMFSGFLYPLYTLLSLISIGNFIENLQMFGVLYFLMTALLKSVVLMLAAVRGIQQLTGIKNYRILIIPASAIALFLGMTMSKNISEHVYRHHFEILVPYVWVPLYLVLPAILLIVTWLRRMKKPF